jgi:uncharacterized lipoprotein YmbA
MLTRYLKSFMLMVLPGLLLTACATTPPTNFYVLEALSQPSVSTTAGKKLMIGIGPLDLPALLERKQIVTRKENNAIQMAEFDQWAAPLKDNILAVLSKNIAAQQPDMVVKAYPWAVYGEMNYRVIIDIDRFDSQLGQAAYLEASWSIMKEKDHSIIRNGQTRLTQALNDSSYENVVRTLNKLLNTFSQQLTQTLYQLPKN